MVPAAKLKTRGAPPAAGSPQAQTAATKRVAKARQKPNSGGSQLSGFGGAELQQTVSAAAGEGGLEPTGDAVVQPEIRRDRLDRSARCGVRTGTGVSGMMLEQRRARSAPAADSVSRLATGPARDGPGDGPVRRRRSSGDDGAELDEFERLLTCPTRTCCAWITGEATTPREFDTALFARPAARDLEESAGESHQDLRDPSSRSALRRLAEGGAVTLARAPEGFDAFVVADLARALRGGGRSRAPSRSSSSPATA